MTFFSPARSLWGRFSDNSYRQYLPNLAQTLKPLNILLRKRVTVRVHVGYDCAQLSSHIITASDLGLSKLVTRRERFTFLPTTHEFLQNWAQVYVRTKAITCSCERLLVYLVRSTSRTNNTGRSWTEEAGAFIRST